MQLVRWGQYDADDVDWEVGYPTSSSCFVVLGAPWEQISNTITQNRIVELMKIVALCPKLTTTVVSKKHLAMATTVSPFAFM